MHRGTHRHTCMQLLTKTCTQTHIRPHTHAHKQKHTHSHVRTRRHTQTYTQTIHVLLTNEMLSPLACTQPTTSADSLQTIDEATLLEFKQQAAMEEATRVPEVQEPESEPQRYNFHR